MGKDNSNEDLNKGVVPFFKRQLQKLRGGPNPPAPAPDVATPSETGVSVVSPTGNSGTGSTVNSETHYPSSSWYSGTQLESIINYFHEKMFGTAEPTDPDLLRAHRQAKESQEFRNKNEQKLKNRNAQLNKEFSTDVKSLEFKLDSCKDWLNNEKRRLGLTLDANKNLNIDLDVRPEIHPNWRFNSVDLKPYYQRLCEQLQCSINNNPTGVSSPLAPDEKDSCFYMQVQMDNLKQQNYQLTIDSHKNFEKLNSCQSESTNVRNELESNRHKLAVAENNFEACKSQLELTETKYKDDFNRNSQPLVSPTNSESPAPIEVPVDSHEPGNSYEPILKYDNYTVGQAFTEILQVTVGFPRQVYSGAIFKKALGPARNPIAFLVYWIFSMLFGTLILIFYMYILLQIFYMLSHLIKYIVKEINSFQQVLVEDFRRKKKQKQEKEIRKLQEQKSQEFWRGLNPVMSAAERISKLLANLTTKEQKQTSHQSILSIHRGGFLIPIYQINVFTLSDFEKEQILLIPFTFQIKVEKLRLELHKKIKKESQIINLIIETFNKQKGIKQRKIRNQELRNKTTSILGAISILVATLLSPNVENEIPLTNPYQLEQISKSISTLNIDELNSVESVIDEIPEVIVEKITEEIVELEASLETTISSKSKLKERYLRRKKQCSGLNKLPLLEESSFSELLEEITKEKLNFKDIQIKN